MDWRAFLSVAIFLICIAVVVSQRKGQKRIDNRPVDPQQLLRLIDRADRLVVRDHPVPDARVLFESRRREDLDDLKQSLSIVVPAPRFHCMCIGSPSIDLYAGSEHIAQLTNHHGTSIRWSGWDSDALLSDSQQWLDWFSQRGIDGLRAEVEASRRSAEADRQQEARWLAAMPRCLDSVWEKHRSRWDFGNADVAVLSRVLVESIPEPAERIGALLHWFGSGAGPWSGYPAREGAAERLLMKEDPDQLISIAQSPDLSHSQLEGTARLLCGWALSRQYPPGTVHIPDLLKQRLWHHVKDTSDNDKLSRARRGLAVYCSRCGTELPEDAWCCVECRASRPSQQEHAAVPLAIQRPNAQVPTPSADTEPEDYCEIALARGVAFTGKSVVELHQFQAVCTGPDGETIVGHRRASREDNFGPVRANRRAVESLVRDLTREQWEAYDRGTAWYSHKLRRKPGPPRKAARKSWPFTARGGGKYPKDLAIVFSTAPRMGGHK